MNAQRARQILQALIQGVDPFNGEELAAGTVLQQADVLRAMLAALAALERGTARSARRAQMPSNVGRPWTQEEEMALINEMQSHMAIDEMAARHGRTLRAIEVRLEKLGLIAAEQRVTRNRYGNLASEAARGAPSASLQAADDPARGVPAALSRSIQTTSVTNVPSAFNSNVR